MFKSKTLFIVGAGASCEVGLPAGGQLRSDIAKLIDIRFKDGYSQSSGDPYIYDALKKYASSKGARDVNYLLHKCWEMAKALPVSAESIDNYLYNHSDDPEMVLIGKLGIAKAILNAERGSSLFPPNRDEFRDGRFNAGAISHLWFMQVAQLLINHVRKSEIKGIFNNIDFIIFNYDRCIERFFPQVIADHYGDNSRTIEESMSKISIIHPYGQVGKLGNSPRDGIPFGSNVQTGLLEIANQINTFDEGVADKNLLDQMHNLLAEAETIVFLGFGFHGQNLELLGPSRPCKVKRIFATKMGLSHSAWQTILGEIIDLVGGKIHSIPKIEAFDRTCSDMLGQNTRALLGHAA